MHLIQVKVNEEIFTPTQKTEITSNLTDATVSIEEGDFCSVAWVDIHEVLRDEWEIGGSALTADAIRTLVAGE